jgi:hypothetical protein
LFYSGDDTAQPTARAEANSLVFQPSLQLEESARRCLNHLYAYSTSRYSNAGKRQTLGELLRTNIDIPDNRVLMPYGVRLERIDGTQALVVATDSSALELIFSGTQWHEGGWARLLKAIRPKLKIPGKTFRFSGDVSRGIIIPLNMWPTGNEKVAHTQNGQS